jgi:hypothetical protein
MGQGGDAGTRGGEGGEKGSDKGLSKPATIAGRTCLKCCVENSQLTLVTLKKEKVEMRLLFGEPNPVRAGPSHPIRRDPEAFPSCSTLETVTDCLERASRRRAGTWPVV